MTTTPLSSKQCEYCSMGHICEHTSTNIRCKANPVARQLQQLKRRELLYSYRDPFKCLYALYAGAIKTFHVDINGQEQIQNFYLPGEIIGLEGIQTGYYPYSAIALVPSKVCEIPFDNLVSHVSDDSSLLNHLISILGLRINLGNYVTAPHAEQRLAAFILDMAKRINHLPAAEIELPMSRYDIGNYLRLAPETISRLFTRFQQTELLQVQQKKIVIIDLPKLQWIAEEGISPSR